ncbi:MAG TPA: TIR domain-containing protein, partial [Candidatus Kapabacteria bacterium]|nr:TIR domain-containing protein [Candidatus Kapabacteria bacterium]
MSDIFVSYSRKDSTQALSLVERLRAHGMRVWIDQQGIGGAEQWATQIASAIRDCKHFIVLLSEHSTISPNVLREVSLASEKNKRIIPIDLEQCELPVTFEYPLAGIQRLAYTDFEQLLAAINGEFALRSSAPSQVDHSEDSRKALMVLPFDDLSQGKDNEWFVDGLVCELINTLSAVSSLRVIDWNTTKDIKRKQVSTAVIARELGVRFFIEGDVRKFGDAIKITLSLLDAQKGNHLWQLTEKGRMDDIFEIQEAVASKVIEGLNIHLTSAQAARLNERGTDNQDAYEMYLKADLEYRGHTKIKLERAIAYLREAITFDTEYARAMQYLSFILVRYYEVFDRDPRHLDEAEHYARAAQKLEPQLWKVLNSLSNIYVRRGKVAEAEQFALDFVKHAPDDPGSHFALGIFYQNSGQLERSIAPYERVLES